MNKTEQRIEIALASGKHEQPIIMYWYGKMFSYDKEKDNYKKIPDYLGDLYALKSAEQSMTLEQILKFETQLKYIIDRKDGLDYVEKRAEAFLKAVGKWLYH